MKQCCCKAHPLALRPYHIGDGADGPEIHRLAVGLRQQNLRRGVGHLRAAKYTDMLGGYYNNVRNKSIC